MPIGQQIRTSPSQPPTSAASGYAAARPVAPKPCRCAPSTAPTGAPGIHSRSRRSATRRRSPPLTTTACRQRMVARCKAGFRTPTPRATRPPSTSSGTLAPAQAAGISGPRQCPSGGKYGHHRRSRRPRQRMGPRRPDGGSETMQVRAFDGTDWSAWDSFNFTTVPTPRRSPPSTTTAWQTNEWSQGAKLDFVLRRRWQCGHPVPVLGRRHRADSGYFWTPDNAHHAADTAITVAAADLSNVWVRGGAAGGSETM